jgi:gamma-tubulin complex component 2
MLQLWIGNGVLEDPFSEFMIQEKNMAKEKLHDLYWERKYTLQNNFTPSFLAPYSEKILKSGKYWNVLRDCGVRGEASSIDLENQQLVFNDTIRVTGGET